mmetsp:Transcript_34433/g.98834  ORF Transcript_34433/g.98834 Transcript_34433/m.98834 type:complete len:152 (-) Transcript_34433:352-807(-)
MAIPITSQTFAAACRAAVSVQAQAAEGAGSVSEVAHEVLRLRELARQHVGSSPPKSSLRGASAAVKVAEFGAAPGVVRRRSPGGAHGCARLPPPRPFAPRHGVGDTDGGPTPRRLARLRRGGTQRPRQHRQRRRQRRHQRRRCSAGSRTRH